MCFTNSEAIVMKILLVEDSATLRQILCNYIRDAGHEPVIATSGEEALQLLENTPVDMIFMDVEMPGLNGFETTKLIREGLDGHWLPIIFITGLKEDDSYIQGIDAGADDYLIKPLSAAIIKAKIRAFERIIQMRDELTNLNQRVDTLSQYDPLTQLLNRKTFTTVSEHHWTLAKRHQHAVSALMIDVDYLKLYNEHCGTAVGDEALQQIAKAIRHSLHRPGDVVCRYAGEEFVVLLPDTDASGAMWVARSINQAIMQLAIAHPTSPVSDTLTVSIGGATCPRTTNQSLEKLIKGAERALYKAKRAGRNRCWIDEIASQKNILIADSDKSLLTFFSDQLQNHFTVSLAETPIECFELALNLQPDAILLGQHLLMAEGGHDLHAILVNTPQTTAIKRALIVPTLNSDSRMLAEVLHSEHIFDQSMEKGALLNKLEALTTRPHSTMTKSV